MSLLSSLGLPPPPQQASRSRPIEAAVANRPMNRAAEFANLSRAASASMQSPASDLLRNPTPKDRNAEILQQKTKPANEIPGAGHGNGLSIGKAEYDKAEELARKGWKWLTEQGETRIIIKNQTSKVMTLVPGTDVRDKPKEARFSRGAPPKIAAGGEDSLVLKTDMNVRGITRGNTSGSVVYEIAGKDGQAKTAKVRLAWTRKGESGMAMKDDWQTDTLGFEVVAQQTADGEFTFFVSESATPAKAKDAQPAEEAKGKGPPPPDTFVLFEVGKAVLKSEARSTLHEYASAYLASGSTVKINCEGYASVEGKDAFNKNLSFERAEAVFNYLTDPKTGNLPQDKVGFHGNGTTQGFDTADPKNFPPNRRVTIGVAATKVPAAKATDADAKPQAPESPDRKKKAQERDREEPTMRPAVRTSASRSGA